VFKSSLVSDAISSAISDSADVARTLHRPFPTGFRPLDGYLADGLRPRELVLLAGRQGTGKTTFAMQVARSVALDGRPVVVASFEHDEQAIVERFVAMELASRGHGASFPARHVVERMRRRHAEIWHDVETWQEALDEVSEWGARVRLIGPSVDSPSVTLEELGAVVRESTITFGMAPLVVVDYLQKFVTPGETDDVRSGRVAVALKELAMGSGAAVLAITAADRDGLVAGRRLRIHHLRGAAVLAYEADVVLVFNDKYDVVARQHLVYDASNAARMHDVVVVSIEKNRGGLDNIDLEFYKQFESNRFDPEGAVVREQLVDDRLYD
jgi:replicative DNA helicase